MPGEMYSPRQAAHSWGGPGVGQKSTTLPFTHTVEVRDAAGCPFPEHTAAGSSAEAGGLHPQGRSGEERVLTDGIPFNKKGKKWQKLVFLHSSCQSELAPRCGGV